MITECIGDVSYFIVAWIEFASLWVIENTNMYEKVMFSTKYAREVEAMLDLRRRVAKLEFQIALLEKCFLLITECIGDLDARKYKRVRKSDFFNKVCESSSKLTQW